MNEKRNEAFLLPWECDFENDISGDLDEHNGWLIVHMVVSRSYSNEWVLYIICTISTKTQEFRYLTWERRKHHQSLWFPHWPACLTVRTVGNVWMRNDAPEEGAGTCNCAHGRTVVILSVLIEWFHEPSEAWLKHWVATQTLPAGGQEGSSDHNLQRSSPKNRSIQTQNQDSSPAAIQTRTMGINRNTFFLSCLKFSLFLDIASLSPRQNVFVYD